MEKLIHKTLHRSQLRCSGRIHSSCSTNDIHRVTPVATPMMYALFTGHGILQHNSSHVVIALKLHGYLRIGIHLNNNIIHEICHGVQSRRGFCCLTITRRVLLVGQELLFCVVFWDPVSIRPFSVGHIIVSLSSVLWSIVRLFLYVLLAIVSSLFFRFCGPLFDLFSIFCWSLYRPSFFGLWFLINPLIS